MKAYPNIIAKTALWLSAAALLCGCPRPIPELAPARHASAAPGLQSSRLDPPDPEATAEAQSSMEPPLYPEPAPGQDLLSLADLVDAALRNNSATRIAWARAKSQAAGWARARSPYWPTVDGTAEAMAGEMPQLQQGSRGYAQIGADISWLLLDFGERGARAEAAREALVAANWSHNQAVQDVLRDVPQAYYAHLADKSRVNAAEQSLREASTTLSATEERRRSGASTVADVLQARAREAKTRLELAASRGAAEISRGRLATAVGWPANAPLQVAARMEEPPLRRLTEGVEGLIEEAEQSRPDLGMAQADVRRREAGVREARALPFPKLTGTGRFNWLRSRGLEEGSYYGGLSLRVPIFHGFDMENALRQARADLEEARARLKLMQESVVQEVWEAYQNYRTAAEKLQASRALLASASESYQVSLARYRQGAADIVELLNAQSTLADARSQTIDSGSEVYNSFAELIHAVGRRISEGGLGEIQERELSHEERQARP